MQAPVGVAVEDPINRAGGLDSIPGPFTSDAVSPTAGHRCEISSQSNCPVAKPQRWVSPLATCIGVIPRV